MKLMKQAPKSSVVTHNANFKSLDIKILRHRGATLDILVISTGNVISLIQKKCPLLENLNLQVRIINANVEGEWLRIVSGLVIILATHFLKWISIDTNEDSYRKYQDGLTVVLPSKRPYVTSYSSKNNLLFMVNTLVLLRRALTHTQLLLNPGYYHSLYIIKGSLIC